MISCIFSVNMWTVCCLFFATIMENSLFHGTIIVWMMMIPFIIMIILFDDAHGLEILTLDYLQAKNGDAIAH